MINIFEKKNTFVLSDCHIQILFVKKKNKIYSILRNNFVTSFSFPKGYDHVLFSFRKFNDNYYTYFHYKK